MVDRSKTEFESAGFVQIIKGIIRTWKGQTDSLVDQCWLNQSSKVISHQNDVCASSDHNLITVIMRIKNKKLGVQVLQKRVWKNFCPATYRAEIDWTDFYREKDQNVMNTIFEENVGTILEKHAPLKCIQLRKHYRNWLDDDCRLSMSDRDKQREVAWLSGSVEDWKSYRNKINKCTKLLKKERKMNTCLQCMTLSMRDMIQQAYTGNPRNLPV